MMTPGKEHVWKWWQERQASMTEEEREIERLVGEEMARAIVEAVGAAKSKARELGVEWTSDPLEWMAMARATGQDGGGMTASEILERLEIELRSLKYRRQIAGEPAAARKPKRRGRKPLTPEVMAELLNQADQYDSDREAAAELEVSHTTIRNYRRRLQRFR